jgi:hypothetical protein
MQRTQKIHFIRLPSNKIIQRGEKTECLSTDSFDSDCLRETELSEHTAMAKYSGMIISHRLGHGKRIDSIEKLARKHPPTHFCRNIIVLQKPLATLDLSNYNERRWQLFAILV